ncbi:MAG TPA: c-type cytochrome, partial [Polyangiaceae bacterium]|nr:c-type cytochrome [Polyangiaceae bacterium]
AAGDEVLLPLVLTDPGNTNVDLVSFGYGSGEERSPVMTPAIVRAPSAENRDVDFLVSGFRAFDCLLPRAALWYARAEKLLVACMGSDTVGYQHLLRGALHGSLLRVAAGPTGMAIDPETNRLVVWSQFAAAITVAELVFDGRLPQDIEPATIRLEPRGAPSELAALGRKLFHAAGDKRLSFDGRACASCHPSGRDDGLTWATFEGPRQTPMLIERLSGTAPYDWNGRKVDLHAHLRRTLRRLAGTGLTAHERRALLAYVSTLEAPRVHRAPRVLATLGAQIFADSSTGCADCHTGRLLTDGLSHDVYGSNEGDKLHEFDTPSLRFVAQSAPYFHDGRYPTLLSMLSDEELHMGSTDQLSEAERDALVAYLHAL